MINILEKTKNYDRIINMSYTDNTSGEIINCYQELLFNSDDLEKIKKTDDLILRYFEDDKLNCYIKEKIYENNYIENIDYLIKLYDEYIEMNLSTITSTKWI